MEPMSKVQHRKWFKVKKVCTGYVHLKKSIIYIIESPITGTRKTLLVNRRQL